MVVLAVVFVEKMRMQRPCVRVFIAPKLFKMRIGMKSFSQALDSYCCVGCSQHEFE
jgi:hypothetical protein